MKSLLLSAISLFAAPAIAWAQPVSGVYVGLGGGGNVLQDQQSRPATRLGLAPKQLNWNVGAVGLGSVGYGFGNGLRVEVEGDYRYNALHRIGGTPFPTQAGGDRQQFAAMANALFDLDIGSPYVFPYLGVGAGYALTQLHKLHDAGTSTPFKFDTTDSDGDFAYQGILGASFPTPWVPGLSFTAEYRFFATADGEQRFHGSLIAPTINGPGQTRGAARLFDDYNHSLLVGLRYEFNPPPPPVAAMPAANVPSPAPAPAAARTYLVFFDWDRADLTPRARQIVAEAAQASTRVQTTRLEVGGYTDTSGARNYNQRLSMRRAETVAAELMRDGVPREVITTQGFGEGHPLVPTGQGVREPQNRRVEIVLR